MSDLFVILVLIFFNGVRDFAALIFAALILLVSYNEYQ